MNQILFILMMLMSLTEMKPKSNGKIGIDFGYGNLYDFLQNCNMVIAFF